MTAFWTLVKTEFLDHKGSAFWVPLVVAALMVLGVATVAVKASNHDGILKIDGDGVRFSTDLKTTDGDRTVKRETLPDGSTRTTITTGKPGSDSFETRVIIQRDDGSDMKAYDKDGALKWQESGPATDMILKNKSPDDVRGAMASISMSMLLLTAAPIIGITLLGTYYMLSSSLYAERIDRSILFWKSMPVSDGQTIGAKFVGTTLVPVAVAFGISIVAYLLCLAIISITGAAQTQLPNLGMLWSPTAIGTALVVTLSFAIAYIAWAAPIYGWVMFASAIAPRAPALFAVVPPVVLIIVERLFTNQSWLGEQIGLRFIGFFPLEKLETLKIDSLAGAIDTIWTTPGMMLGTLFTPGCLIGLVVAGGLLYAATEVRRRKAL
jgi:ABC-2 type transport system permease protein